MGEELFSVDGEYPRERDFLRLEVIPLATT